ncbi:MAG: glycoside hydrolase family 43 protein [Bacteroidales bacterium]|nr:glycoside hydrolase family 43 protein [Bacteroidales bacterium]MCL2133623.1 glycoside hydrolase family 43 protein [Bacteroidales bacterium]
MKKLFHINWPLGLLSMLLLYSCSNDDKTATFRYFEYKGADPVFTANIDDTRQYYNPILLGCYPDPSICRKDNDYYLVTSTFAYYPGIPIFHSTDLVNWVQIGNVLNRPSQLNLDNIRIDGGVYAPVIRYNPYNDMYYLINTCVDGIGNFVVKTKDPKQNNWSEPIMLPKVGGIDPSLFFDEDGKAYIVHNDAPQGEPEWQGHRAIWLHEYDVAADTTLNGCKMIVDGGVDKRKRPIWIEAPHIYKINGYYYLMCAEGGTREDHSEVIFRADEVWGPYIPWENNPILTQRDLANDRSNPVTCTGHVDLIQTIEGDWYAVFLACRPYEKDYFNTGRETFMLPLQWENEYPVILSKGQAIPFVVDKEKLQPNSNSYKGNFTWRDDFKSATLDHRWLFIRTPRTTWWSLSKNGLVIEANGQSIYKKEQPAFIGYRQQHLCFNVTTEMQYTPSKTDELAGLVCYQNEGHNIVFGKTLNEQGVAVMVVDLTVKGEVKRIAEVEIPKEHRKKAIEMNIKSMGKSYAFLYSYDQGINWTVVAETEAKVLSTEVAGGFTGVVVGMWASR